MTKLQTKMPGNEAALMNMFMGEVLKNPRKLYFLLNMAGFSSIDAQRVIWNLNYARIRTSNPKVRAQLLSFLKNLIDTITTDKILYSRFRSLAMGKKLGTLGLNVKEDFSFGVPAGESGAVSMGGSSLQGVLGTNLGVPYSGPSVTGIDSYDTILGSLLRRQNIKPKKKKRKKHKKIKFPM